MIFYEAFDSQALNEYQRILGTTAYAVFADRKKQHSIQCITVSIDAIIFNVGYHYQICGWTLYFIISMTIAEMRYVDMLLHPSRITNK